MWLQAADAAQRLFVGPELDGLSKIGRFLHPAAHRPSTKAVLGVIRNLAQRPANHQALREKHTVEQVFIALSAALDQLAVSFCYWCCCRHLLGIRLKIHETATLTFLCKIAYQLIYHFSQAKGVNSAYVVVVHPAILWCLAVVQIACLQLPFTARFIIIIIILGGDSLFVLSNCFISTFGFARYHYVHFISMVSNNKQEFFA